MVHPEVILKGYGGIGLCSILHFYIFLRFYRLMQAVRIPAALHYPSSLLIHNLYFLINKDVFGVLLKHTVSLQQLIDGMDTLRFYTIILDQLFFTDQSLLVIQDRIFLNFGNLYSYIRKNEKVNVLIFLSNGFNPIVSKIYGVGFFINGEQQRFVRLRHHALVVL